MALDSVAHSGISGQDRGKAADKRIPDAGAKRTTWELKEELRKIQKGFLEEAALMPFYVEMVPTAGKAEKRK